MSLPATNTDVEIIAAGQLTLQESINHEHKLARQSADTAIEHAVRCGELLIDQKAELPHGEFKKWIAENCDFSARQARRYMEVSKKKTDPRVRFDSLRQALGYNSRNAHVGHNSGENEWYTPPDYIEAARTVMGEIDVDPASSDLAQRTVQAAKYFTKQKLLISGTEQLQWLKVDTHLMRGSMQCHSQLAIRTTFQGFGSVVHHPAFTRRCTALPLFLIVLIELLYIFIVTGRIYSYNQYVNAGLITRCRFFLDWRTWRNYARCGASGDRTS